MNPGSVIVDPLVVEHRQVALLLAKIAKPDEKGEDDDHYQDEQSIEHPTHIHLASSRVVN